VTRRERTLSPCQRKNAFFCKAIFYENPKHITFSNTRLFFLPQFFSFGHERARRILSLLNLLLLRKREREKERDDDDDDDDDAEETK